jgi:alanine dehydrogenase
LHFIVFVAVSLNVAHAKVRGEEKKMKISVVAEVKNNEFRVAITPAGVHELVLAGHSVFVQAGAGVGSSISDSEYVAAGAQITPDAVAAWAAGEMIMKVKEPIASEYDYLRPGMLLFTYLHLAADPELTKVLLEREVTAIAYETVQLPNRALPLLAPMSEVAATVSCLVACLALAQLALLFWVAAWPAQTRLRWPLVWALK